MIECVGCGYPIPEHVRVTCNTPPVPFHLEPCYDDHAEQWHDGTGRFCTGDDTTDLHSDKETK